MKYLSSTIIFVHNFTLKITSARACIRARFNQGPVVSLIEKNKGPGYQTSKYGVLKPNLLLFISQHTKIFAAQINVRLIRSPLN